MDSNASQELNKSTLTLEECQALYVDHGRYAVIKGGKVVELRQEKREA